MVTVEIRLRSVPERRLSEVLGPRHLYRKGTNPEMYVDFQDRAEADLAVVNLRLLPAHARVMPDPWPSMTL